jgi:hypothetical protein
VLLLLGNARRREDILQLVPDAIELVLRQGRVVLANGVVG